jgi:hypothetical protein
MRILISLAHMAHSNVRAADRGRDVREVRGAGDDLELSARRGGQ